MSAKHDHYYQKYSEDYDAGTGLLSAIDNSDYDKVYQIIKKDIHFEKIDLFASLIFRNPKSSISADKRNKLRSILFIHLLEICDAKFECISGHSYDHYLVIRPKTEFTDLSSPVPVNVRELNFQSFTITIMEKVYFYIEDNWEVLNYAFPNLFELPNTKDIFNKYKYQGREIEYGFLYLIFIQRKLEIWIKNKFKIIDMMDNFLCKNPHYKPHNENIIFALDFKALNELPNIIDYKQVKQIFLATMSGLRSYLTLPILIKYNMREDVVKVLIASKFVESGKHLSKESLKMTLDYLQDPSIEEFMNSDHKFLWVDFKDEKREPLFYKDLIISDYSKLLNVDLLANLGIKNRLVKKTVYPSITNPNLKHNNATLLNLMILNILPIIKDVQQQQILVDICNSSKQLDYKEHVALYEGIHCLQKLEFFESNDHFIRFVKNGFKDPILFRDLIEPLNMVFRERLPNQEGLIDFSEYMIGSEFEERFMKKFKGSTAIKQMHDWVSRNCVYGKKAEFHQKEIMAIDEMPINNYTIRVAKSNQDLIDAGTTLSICVGNGTYYGRIMMGQSYIFFLSKYTDKLSTWDYCIELNNLFMILQAKGRNNNHLDRSFRKDLEDVIRRIIKKELTFSEKLLTTVKNLFNRRENV